MIGIIKLVLVIIISFILFRVNIDIIIGVGFFICNIKYIIYIIVNIFIYFFKNIFMWLIIDRFFPNYYPLAIIFFYFIYLIEEKLSETTYNMIGWDLYIRIILYVISFISVLIHNEIVIINICGLASYTKYGLDIKFKNEELYANTDDSDIIKKFETLNEIDLIVDKVERS